MKDWEAYKARAVFGFNRPIEFNWEGKMLRLAHVGQDYVLMPFGPNSDRRILVTITMIDEDKELVTVTDTITAVDLTFDVWTYMKPYHVPSGSARYGTIKTKDQFDALIEQIYRRQDARPHALSPRSQSGW